MTCEQADGVLAEGAIPSEQLVEGVALGAVALLAQQATSSSLVAMIHVHVAHVRVCVIVQTEVDGQLQTLSPAHVLTVRAESEASTQTSCITTAVGLIICQHTQ